MLNIIDLYKETKQKIKFFNKCFGILQINTILYIFLSFAILLGAALSKNMIAYGIFNMCFSILLFIYLCTYENKSYNQLFKLFIKNRKEIIKDDLISDFKNSNPDYQLLEHILKNTNISKEDLNNIISNLKELTPTEKEWILLTVLSNCQNII